MLFHSLTSPQQAQMLPCCLQSVFDSEMTVPHIVMIDAVEKNSQKIQFHVQFHLTLPKTFKWHQEQISMSRKNEIMFSIHFLNF